MRAGLSTIQQTLTPEAASVLNHSIVEAGRRNHGQTTPLHVAATLLSSSNGFLRQACIKSHPNSSHPLQCRALELCFSVALERLPTAQTASPGTEPPISNALMAALKRAQAHQRRGCPEQQQQPLLAVKVELEQLIISILDDPSVSRVMREASFSSPAVKATIEQSLNSSARASSSPVGGLGFRHSPAGPPRNLYLNPRMQQQGSIVAPLLQQHRGEEVGKVIDILLRSRKRNPVLVGESEPEAVVKELLRRIENGELGDGALCKAQVIHLEKEICGNDRSQIGARIKHLVESRMENLNGGGGVVLDMGNLQWLVQQQPATRGGSGSGTVPQPVVSEGGRAAVAEIGKLLAKHGNGDGGRLWLIGTATCETYLRCQVYHPSMENDWDLQALPITARAPLLGLFPRPGTTGVLNRPVESLSMIKGFSTKATVPIGSVALENLDSSRKTRCCARCIHNYEQELEKLVAKELDKPSSVLKLEGGKALPLPLWLQNAKAEDEHSKKHEATIESLDEEQIRKHKTRELEKKWHDTCLRLHPNFHNLNKFGPNLLGHQLSQPKLQLNKAFGEKVLSSLQPGSPVRTELALGRMNDNDNSAEQTHKEQVKDFLGCISSEPESKVCELRSGKFLNASDIDSYKRLFKGILEKVWWQQEAASALATSVTQFKLGNGKRRGTIRKGDMWLLFLGPDRVGKKKMATALAELVSGSNPVTICLGSKRSDGGIRGRTVLDRISEAVRRNRFSVIVLDDFDESDLLLHGSIKKAMERGRFTDSHGREISLGNIIFILTSNWIPNDMKHLSDGNPLEEEKLASLARSTWELKLSLSRKTIKRRLERAHGEERCSKLRTETSPTISFDLNETADTEDEKTDGSLNSSDVTIEHETEHGLNIRQLSFPSPSKSQDIFERVDDAIIFKPVDFASIKHNITSSINKKFSSMVGEKISLDLHENALEKITSGVWLSNMNVDEWIEKVLVPSLKELKASLPSFDAFDSMAVRLDADDSSGCWGSEDQLPRSIKVVVGENCEIPEVNSSCHFVTFVG
ncbi:protein SUPPRESSOR OF MAX2 1-like [Cucurbita moschata]|uniref:Protein SUPPRESSOR OF MAX2 1-like n=1 Tax=Cucurbita moschata TaxID=3662 RepID=A0A6J1FC71_CUCMO|nr:protein SUPPRESSOR OF MAX2 1-like [Cucurbita moschata]